MTQGTIEIIKRDGSTVQFDKDKIIIAVGKAMVEIGSEIDETCTEKIAEKVKLNAMKAQQSNELLTVEEIQDIVELELMREYPRVAKAYILYRNERSKARNQMWEMTDLQRDIYEQKYKYEDETFEEFLDRVSDGDKLIKEAIRKKEFMPAGRILAGMDLYNKGKKVTLSNCYVMPKVSDNIESIFDTAKYLARTYSYGGGVGLSISNLRPKGAKVNNAANTTTGAVSFMELYSLVTTLIGMRGRRGALMLNIDVSHPDIEDFIDIKNDLDKVTGANISVNVDNEFMEAVKNDTLYRLHFTVDSTGEVIERNVRARELFKKLAQNNWNMAEPGILYQDRIDSWHLMSEDPDFEFAGVNPCFTGDMKLLTAEGYKELRELKDKKVDIYNVNGQISQGKVWSNGIKDTIKLTLSNNETITCTPDHVFMTIDGAEVEAKDLKSKKIMPYMYNRQGFNTKYERYGFMQGDSNLGRITSDTHKGIEVFFNSKDHEVKELFKECQYTEGDNYLYVQEMSKDLLELGFDPKPLPERTLPKTYNTWSTEQQRSFLRGLYSANGSVISGHRVSFKTTSKGLANELVETLNNIFDIKAYITTNKTKKVQFDNGIYQCKESYDVNISQYKHIQTFANEIGFIQSHKNKSMRELLEIKAPYVRKIEDNGKEEVFDFNEPITHWGVIEGYIAHNCAEETLPAFGSCNLSSINLSELIRNPYTDEAYFDKERFEKLTRAGVRYLNHVLDINMELHPLEQQREMSRDYRQIGLVI